MADAFDLSKLAVGDEVGIEQKWFGDEVSQVVVLVTAVDEDGIEADSDWFDKDGQSLSYPDKRRLVAPTDEGRIVALREGIGVELNILGGKLKDMPLPALRRLRAVLVGLIAGVTQSDAM